MPCLHFVTLLSPLGVLGMDPLILLQGLPAPAVGCHLLLFEQKSLTLGLVSGMEPFTPFPEHHRVGGKMETLFGVSNMCLQCQVILCRVFLKHKLRYNHVSHVFFLGMFSSHLISFPHFFFAMLG